MKNIFFTFLVFIYLAKQSFVFGQHNASYPQTFQTYLSNGGYCPNLDYKGSIHYDTQTNKIVVCKGINNLQSGSSVWKSNSNGINYLNGIVGIGAQAIRYGLEMGNNTTAKFANNLLVKERIGIGNYNPDDEPDEKLEILDDDLIVKNSTSTTKWIQKYRGNNDRFELYCSNNSLTIAFNSNGNVGVGTSTPSHKLSVVGDGAFTGSITSAGNGLLRNTASTQLVFFLCSVVIPASFNVPGNSCTTIDIELPPAYFKSPPAVAFSNKYNDGLTDSKIIITIENVTNATARLRFCNSSTIARTISAYEGYNLICFGEFY